MIAVIVITTILMLSTIMDASADIDTIIPYPKEIRAVGMDSKLVPLNLLCLYSLRVHLITRIS